MARWKQLKGIAGGIAHQFNASREYFDFMMRENRIDEVRIDMLSETVEPELFNIPRNINLIHLCATNLRRLLSEQYGHPVESATLHLTPADTQLIITATDGRIVSGVCTQERIVLPGGNS